MTYSHNSIGNNNFKMTTTTLVTTKSIKIIRGKSKSGGGGNNNNNNDGGGGDQNYRTPTKPIAIKQTSSEKTTFNCIQTNTLHSNSIACSTNQQHHPLMCGDASPPNAYALSFGSYFGQRKQKVNVRQSPGTNIIHNSTNSINSGSGFFYKNAQQTLQTNYYTPNNNNNNSNKKQQQQQQQNNNNNKQQQQQRSPQQSPTTILSNSFSGENVIKNAFITTNASLTTGCRNKRRPKLHLQSPIITAPNDLGVGGNISPTHPLLPTVLTHFAGSKCFDAPAPSAVPKPPQHWTQLMKSTTAPAIAATPKTAIASNNKTTKSNFGLKTCAGQLVKSSKRNLLDDFDTHNLKLLLNVHS